MNWRILKRSLEEVLGGINVMNVKRTGIVALSLLCALMIFMTLCPVKTTNEDEIITINLTPTPMIEEVPVIRPEPLIFSMEVDGVVKEMSAEEYLDEIFVEVEEWEPPKSDKSYYGTMECTAYIATGNPCADGQWPELCWTVACNDPALWHKRIHIEGLGDYYVHDTGGMASNVIDIFVESYDAAINFGRQTREVYVYE